MNKKELLALYDQEQRIDMEWPGSRREVTPYIVRLIDLTDQQNHFVAYSRLTAVNANDVIQTELDYLQALGGSFEWKVHDHDQPADLRQRLLSKGLEADEPEAIMVLDLEMAPSILLQPVTADIRRITTPSQIDEAVISILKEVWQKDFNHLKEELSHLLKNQTDFVTIYTAYVDGIPACAAWIKFPPRTQFASLWGGSTVASYRKRGLYTAVLATRVQEAIRRGYRFLTIDASPMSQPIVTKHGFQLLTYAHACRWDDKPSA